MKRIIAFALVAMGAQFIGLQNTEERKISATQYRDYIRNHPFSQVPELTPREIEALPKADRPDLAFRQNFISTMDPDLGRPTPEVLVPVMRQLSAAKARGKTPGVSSNAWQEMGPDNVGGRTRGIMFDPNDPSHNKVWAGGISGGLWVNNNIASASSKWQAVNDFWSNIAVSSLDYDPTDSTTFYAGTGEGWGQGFSGTQGAGVWKSTNGGASWSQLAATSAFTFVNDVVVRNENGNGVLYVGVVRSAERGLHRSTDGGQTFTKVFNKPVADLEIDAANKLWVGTIESTVDGSGGGDIHTSTDGVNFSTAYSSNLDRVKLATAPSDTNYAYAIIENGGQVSRIVRTNDGGQNWTFAQEPNDDDNGIPANDFSRGQAWYDLSLAVDPNDPKTILAGGINLFRSQDSGQSWTQLSHWFGGFGHPYVHADQHEIRYVPGNSSEAIFANDGGIHYSTNLQATSPLFNERNNNYNVTQFYSVAFHPAAGSNIALGGTQDNGTQRFQFPGINSTQRATGGDGGFCFIDQTDPNVQITSFTRNSYNRSLNGGLSFNSTLQRDNSGRFINPADYDDNLNILYSAKNFRSINRIKDVDQFSASVDDFTARSLGNTASHLRVSPYHPNRTVLFVGTTGGNILRYDDAHSDDPVETSLFQSNLPNGSVSCIEIGESDEELLATYSNYGINNVWYSDDGGQSWNAKDGNLPNMPVRWALFNPNNRSEVIIATELGVWKTQNIQATNPQWSASKNGMANVRTDMFQLRAQDNTVIAATHGRGFFQSDGFGDASQAPVAEFRAHDTLLCDPVLGLYDRSSGVPASWSWSISPSSYTFVRGTDANSRNPQVEFSDTGRYDITLTVSNSFGNSTETKTQFIYAGESAEPSISKSGDSILTASPAGFDYQWYRNGQPLSGETGRTLKLTQPGDYEVELINGRCRKISDELNIQNIGLDDFRTPSTLFSVYPNPVTSDRLNIRIENEELEKAQVSLVSLEGKVLAEWKALSFQQGLGEIRLDRDLTSGIYILRLQTSGESRYRKIEVR